MFNFRDLLIDREQLISWRKELYKTDGKGYILFKNFIPEKYVEHIRNFWLYNIDPSKSFKNITGKNNFTFGCPNYCSNKNNDRYFHDMYFNFMWNYPADEVTHQMAFLIMSFLNQIESKPVYSEFYPVMYGGASRPERGRALSYRVVNTKRGTSVPSHKDFHQEDVEFDPAKLQATLFLSKKGIDYDGEGFIFETNTGGRVVFGDDVEVEPGDLVVWRYCNLHSVENISTKDEQIGFLRVLFPREIIYK